MVSRETLEAMLGEDCSLEEMGRRVERHPSTVSYWLRKHGLTPNGASVHAARGGIPREVLEPLIAAGLSGRQIAGELGCSLATVRHWLGRLGLETKQTARRRALMAARADDVNELTLGCLRCGSSKHRFFADRGSSVSPVAPVR